MRCALLRVREHALGSSRSRLLGSGFAIGIALALLDILLAAWLFTRVYRYAVRSGLLARYSAESVS